MDEKTVTLNVEAGGVTENAPEVENSPGVIGALGALPAGAIVTEEGLAKIFRRCTMSVKRAVERGELPWPVKMFGQNTWTVGAVLRHVEDRLEQAKKESGRMKKQFSS